MTSPSGNSEQRGVALFYSTLDATQFDLSRQDKWTTPVEVSLSWHWLTSNGDNSSNPYCVYKGWYPASAQIGQTGKTVSPKLYLAAGISGAIQHKVGMQASENIVAINKDANAPIFEFSDLGIVGDLNKILPKLTEAVKAKKGG